MPLKHNNIKYPRMTEMLSEADNPSFGLMPWVGKCAVEWIKKQSVIDPPCVESGYRACEGKYLVSGDELEEAKTHYKTVSQEALDVGSAVHSMIEEFFSEQTG